VNEIAYDYLDGIVAAKFAELEAKCQKLEDALSLTVQSVLQLSTSLTKVTDVVSTKIMTTTPTTTTTPTSTLANAVPSALSSSRSPRSRSTRCIKFEDEDDEVDDDDCNSQASWSSSLYEKVREEAHNQGVFESKYARGRKNDEWISSQFDRIKLELETR